MELIYKNTNDLIIYDKELRINNDTIHMLIESIKEFGFINPIIINEDNIIICGTARLRVAQLLKINEVPCIVVDNLTDEQQKIYRLVDNKISESTYWNYNQLNKELKNINANLFKYDLSTQDYININIDDFFEEASQSQMSLFSEE